MEPLLEPEAAVTLNSRAYPYVRLFRARLKRIRRTLLMLIFVTACFKLMLIYWISPKTPKTVDLDVPNVYSTASPVALSKTQNPAGLQNEFTTEKNITIKSPDIDRSDFKPQWTWTCRNNTCQRIQAIDTDHLSLATCSAFCGPPQPLSQSRLSKDIVGTMVDIESIKFKAKNGTSEELTDNLLSNAFDLFIDDLRRVAVTEASEDVPGNSTMASTMAKPVHDTLVHINYVTTSETLLLANNFVALSTDLFDKLMITQIN